MTERSELDPIVIAPRAGREYPMGRMTAVFKADLKETDSTLSVSEWWLEPNTEGPDAHSHPEAHMFYVIEGSLAVYLAGTDWFDAEQGSYVYVPGGLEHAFENRSDKTAGFMSINTPGGFETMAPHIKSYFEENPLGDAK